LKAKNSSTHMFSSTEVKQQENQKGLYRTVSSNSKDFLPFFAE